MQLLCLAINFLRVGSMLSLLAAVLRAYSQLLPWSLRNLRLEKLNDFAQGHQVLQSWLGLNDSGTSTHDHFAGQPTPFLRYLWCPPQNVSTSSTHFSLWEMLWLLPETHLRVWQWRRDAASSHRFCPWLSSALRHVAFLNLKLRCAQAGADRISPSPDNENAFLACFELKENFPFFINIYSSCGCRVERFRVLVFN